MELNLGYRGATRQSWMEKPVRDLVFSVAQENPKASKERLVEICAERMREDEDYLNAAADYIVTNALNALAQARASTKTKSTGHEEAIEDQAIVKSIKEQIMLMNLEMPNGKRMRYCTGDEMAKFGGLYARIAKRVGKTKRVGEVLSEAQVRGMLEHGQGK